MKYFCRDFSIFEAGWRANARLGGIVKVEGGGGQIVRAVAQERSLTLQIITATVVVVKQLELSSCFCTFSQNIWDERASLTLSRYI